MFKKLWFAPVMLVAVGCAHDPAAKGGTTQKQEEQEPIACTDIGCSDQASIELKRPNAAWAEGNYELELAVDGQANACPFRVPADLPARGNVAIVPCTAKGGASPVQVMISQVVTCTEQRHEDAVSQTCQPVPERFTIQLSVASTPDALELKLSRDGSEILERLYEPTYDEARPNGPQCEPLCRQAHLEEVL